MKRINEDDLQRTALSKGATIAQEGGPTVNPGARRLELARAPTVPRVAETPPPEPPPLADPAALMARAVRENGQTLAALISGLTRELRAQQSMLTPHAPITRWDFKIQRDPDTRDLIGVTALASRTAP